MQNVQTRSVNAEKSNRLSVDISQKIEQPKLDKRKSNLHKTSCLKTNIKKVKMIIDEIKSIYPNKMVLNATQMTRIIGISLRTFSRIITSKEWNKIPQFKSEEVKRKDGMKSTKYQFNIFDIAEFLAKK